MSRKNRRNHNYYKRTSFNNFNKDTQDKNIRHSIEKNYEYWVDFDQRGNVTHKKIIFKNPEEIKGKILEFWITYNEMGNETHFVRNDGFEYWCKYNKDGNITNFWDNTGYSEKFKYYKERFVYKETSSGDKTRYIFNKEKDTPITLSYFN